MESKIRKGITAQGRTKLADYANATHQYEKSTGASIRKYKLSLSEMRANGNYHQQELKNLLYFCRQLRIDISSYQAIFDNINRLVVIKNNNYNVKISYLTALATKIKNWVEKNVMMNKKETDTQYRTLYAGNYFQK